MGHCGEKSAIVFKCNGKEMSASGSDRTFAAGIPEVRFVRKAEKREVALGLYLGAFRTSRLLLACVANPLCSTVKRPTRVFQVKV